MTAHTNIGYFLVVRPHEKDSNKKDKREGCKKKKKVKVREENLDPQCEGKMI